MKATDVIRRDHRAAEDLFEQYKQAEAEERETLSQKIFEALTAHEKMEDTYFYPALMDTAPSEDKANFEELEAEQSELEVETVEARAIAEFNQRDVAIIALMEKVLAHAKKEEDEILSRADEIMSDDTQEELGDKMEPESAVAKG